jgi:integrase
MPRRNAQGAGTIRQRKDGKWEARYTVGRDPGTGKQKQKSIYADTQKEALKRLRQIQNDIENSVYVEPSKLTVGAWLDIWAAEYLGGVKPATKAGYEGNISKHIKPELGAVLLQKLQPHEIQAFYNDLQRGGKAAKTVRNIHGTLHAALDQAVRIGYVKHNVSSLCALPRVVKREMKVLSDDVLMAFFNAIEGNRYEAIFFIDLLTGMRQGEILGLT